MAGRIMVGDRTGLMTVEQDPDTISHAAGHPHRMTPRPHDKRGIGESPPPIPQKRRTGSNVRMNEHDRNPIGGREPSDAIMKA